VTRYPCATVLAVAHYGTVGLLGMLCEGIHVEQYLSQRPDHLAPGYGALLGYCRCGRQWQKILPPSVAALPVPNPCIDSPVE
jgi:hypothetical protein